MEHSRASTTRLQPSSRANSTPAALVTVICVEAWIGKSGESLRINLANAHVLHNRRVHAGGDDGAQIIFRVGQFVFKNERVESDVALHAAPVQKFHQLRQIGLGEIVRAHPRVEFFEAEINRVRAVFDGGLGAFPIAGGREQFRQFQILNCGLRIWVWRVVETISPTA